MRRASCAVLVVLLVLAACQVRQVRVEPHPAPFTPVTLTTPVKAHLADGSVVVYPQGGVRVTATSLEGPGERFDLLLASTGAVTSVPLDSVLALESYRTGTDAAASVLLSGLATVVGAAGMGLLAVAIFGSCPTIYADSAGTAVLQGEAFSYSIAPLFERRDVDRVYARPDAEGRVWLELRNEALETHYINSLELLEVPHDAGERVLPDPLGQPLSIGGLVPAVRAVDAAGREVAPSLARADDAGFETAPAIAAEPRAHGYQDHIELTFALPEARDSVGLVLRLRNSLLNTVLFYDVMLGAAGARSVDWLSSTLDDVGHAAAVGLWYRDRSGIRVSVERAGAFVEVGRVQDTGPIADKEVAVVLPANGARDLRVRLEFLADSWRIDQVAMALDVGRPVVRTLPLTVVTTTGGPSDTAAVSRLRQPDERYLTTSPGHALRIGFDGARAVDAGSHAYLLAAQGYYVEWVRSDWVREATSAQAFTPGDAALDSAYAKWTAVRGEFERQFYERRVPTRQP